MASLKSELVDLLSFNDWATRLLHETVGQLPAEDWIEDVGGSFGSIQGTVAHAVGAEWIWLERWKGTSPSSVPDWTRDPEASTLRDRWEAVASRRGEWLSSLSDEDLRKVLSYRRLAGEPESARLDLLIRHVVNHSTYHRGQVTAFLRNLGRTPPSTDLVLWDRLRAG